MFKLKIETSFVPVYHSGENILTGLKELLQSWRVNEDQQLSVTKRGAVHVVSALSCFDHRLYFAIGKFTLCIPQITCVRVHEII